MSWLVWLLLVAVYWSLKWSFKNALMPKWLALPWGSVHFAIWDVLVRAAHRVYGFRAAPWKEIRPGLWLGKYVLASHVPALKALGIKRVLNLQAENVGPVAAYREAGIEQLYLPVIDHCEPSPEQIEEGVCFIERAIADGHGCYVHCQGGHGRSAAIVFAFLCHTEEHHTPAQHNAQLYASWRVRQGLHRQPSVNHFLDKRSKAKAPRK